MEKEGEGKGKRGRDTDVSVDINACMAHKYIHLFPSYVP